MLTPETTDLIPRQTLTEMVGEYRQAQQEVAQGLALLGTARGRLLVAFGPYCGTVLPQRFNDYSLEPDRREKLLAECYGLMRRSAWRALVDRTDLTHMMSPTRRNALREQLDKGTLPEIDEQTLLASVRDWAANLDNYIQEAVQTVFRSLTPQWSKHKTVNKVEVGKKVIISYAVSYAGYSRSPFSLTYGRATDELRDIANVFSLLDGQGPARYPTDLETAMQAAMAANQQECQTPYFHARWYTNGNLHLTFLRTDLVAELNRRAGGANLRPPTAQ